MKNLIVLIVFLHAVNHLKAQIAIMRTPSRASEISSLNSQRMGTIALIDFSSRAGTAKLLEDLHVVGTPYDKEENSMGIFYLGDSLIKIPTRLNYYANGFEYEIGGKTYVTTSSTIDSIKLDGDTYVFRTFDLKGNKLSRALKVMDRRGKNAIYLYRGVEFQQEVKPGPLVDYHPAQFKWSDPIYLFEIGNQLLVLNNFKGLMAAYPGKEDEIKKFVKENNISKDDPGELRTLFGYVIHL